MLNLLNRSTLAKGAAILSLWACASAPMAADRLSSSERGTVTEVRSQSVKGEGSGLGMIAGGVVGGLVGNQVGKGTGNTIATVGGAVAGGYAGHEIEKNSKKKTVYKTKVRLDNGQTREYKLSRHYAVGDRVRTDGGKVRPLNAQ